MSRIVVQCKGSGTAAPQGLVRKAACRSCGKSVEVASNGRLRKHMRTTTTAAIRRGR